MTDGQRLAVGILAVIVVIVLNLGFLYLVKRALIRVLPNIKRFTPEQHQMEAELREGDMSQAEADAFITQWGKSPK